MFTIEKIFEISASHALDLDYKSPCENIHGHNWLITVICQSETLNKNGMIIDFAEIKRLIHGKLDHQDLNDVLDINPTAENLAKWICEQIPLCTSVSVQESANNKAIYHV
jgi:6-pyruvoyltetrahydropterin/6-carboxytetrahydropterin synthase